MTEAEIRNYLRNINKIGVPIRQMARDAGIHWQSMTRLLSDQEMWQMRNETKETLELYIEWIEGTLGLN